MVTEIAAPLGRKFIRAIPIYSWINTPKGTSGEEILWEVGLDRELEIARLEVYFPVGCEGQVEVRIMRDQIQEYPYAGVYKGDDVILINVSRRVLPPGSRLLVKWENKDPVNDLAFSVHLSTIEYAVI